MSSIKQLEQDIQQNLNVVKAKRVELAQLKKEKKKNTPFSETSLGKAWFGTLRTISRPFKKVHTYACLNIDQPFTVQSNKLAKISSKLLEKACKLDRDTKPKECTLHAVTLAEHVMDLEDFLERREFFHDVHLSDLATLHYEVDRLRPPKDEKKIEEIKQQISLLETIVKKEIMEEEQE